MNGSQVPSGGVVPRSMPGSRPPGHPEPAVLHVVRKLDVGGLEVALVHLIRRLAEKGFRQGVCCMEQRGSLASRLPDAVPVWSCGEGRTSRLQRPELRAARVIREFAPDVIHAENVGAWIDAGLGWLIARRPGRLAFTMHGWDQVRRMPRRRAFICRQLARITAGVTAVSKETAEAFAGETGIRPDRIGVLSLGVDTDLFSPRVPAVAPQAGPVIFGCVARLDPIKGHDVLFEASKILLQNGTEGFEIRIIGDGPRRRELEELSRSNGTDRLVNFLGERSDIPDQLRALDVFVLPSRREGRPLSIMEAAATGLPTIATRVGSVDTLLSGEAGILVEPGDAAGLADAMRRLCRNPELRAKLGRNARRRAVDEYSLKKMVDEHVSFYRRLAATSKASAS